MSDYFEMSSSFIASGPTEIIIDCLFGPLQHNEHCKGWRWHLYMADMDKREAAVRAEVRKMIAERRAAEDVAEAA